MAYFELITRPEPLVTLDDFRAHIGLVEDDDTPLAEVALMSALDYIDGFNGYLHRALLSQQWCASFAPGEALTVDGQQGFDFAFGPLVQVDTFEALVNGSWQTVPSTDYVTRNLQRTWRLRTTTTAIWPVPDEDEQAWRVTFTAGLTEARNVPLSIIAAVKILATHLFENRGESSADIPPAVYALLGPYKVIVI